MKFISCNLIFKFLINNKSQLKSICRTLLSHFSRVWLCATHRRQPTRLLCPWDCPGKNTGVGCHFLLQCIKGKSESEVAQSCSTLCDPTDCSLRGSSIHGIFQARVLEWVAIAFSDTSVASSFCLLWVILPWTWVYKYLFESSPFQLFWPYIHQKWSGIVFNIWSIIYIYKTVQLDAFL